MRLTRREFTLSAGIAGLAVFGAGAGLTFAPKANAEEVPTDPEVIRFTGQDPAIRYLGQPVNSQIGARCPRTGFEDGAWVVYQVFKGSPNTDRPATFVVSDVATGAVIRAIKLPTAEGCFDLTVATDGRVYLPSYFDYHLWRYDPATKQVDDLGEIDPDPLADYAFGAGYGPDGEVFLGTYKDTRLHSVDPETGAITNLGPIDPDAEHIHNVCWDPATNAVFCATGSQRAAVWRIDDLGRGTKTKIVDGSVIPILDDTAFMGMLDCVEGRLVMRSQGRLIVTDVSGNIEFYNNKSELSGYHVVPTRDRTGFIFSSSGTLRKYDFASRSHAPVAGTVRGFIGHAIEVSDGIIKGTDEGGPFTVNYLTGERSEQEISFRQPTKIQKIFPGAGDTMYASGYMSGLAKINTDGGEPNHTVNAGQFESWMERDGLMYLAAYGNTNFYRYDPNTPQVLPKRLFHSASANLDRPFALAYNPDRDEVYIGSVGGYGHHQGGLSIYDFATGAVRFMTEEIAKNQSIISAVYNPHDKLVHIGTSIDGGMGMDPTSVTTEGQLVVFDPATSTVVRRSVPIAGKEGVTGLLIDPDGSVWGLAESQLFKVSPAGEVRTFGTVGYGYAAPPAYTWAWGYLNWSAMDGHIYGSAADNLFRIDPTTGVITRLADSGASWAATDTVGDVYFAFRTHLFKYVVPYLVSGPPNDTQKCHAVNAYAQGRGVRFPDGYKPQWKAIFDRIEERVANGETDDLRQVYCGN
ncbi:hypothetical protein ACQBAU_01740 [Propionibacteriaceae bacterium Y2011]